MGASCKFFPDTHVLLQEPLCVELQKGDYLLQAPYWLGDIVFSWSTMRSTMVWSATSIAVSMGPRVVTVVLVVVHCGSVVVVVVMVGY